MSWYKKSQEIEQQYQDMLNAAKAINITGTGINESIIFPGTTISAREILDKVKIRLLPILLENNVREINTDPIADPQSQGLAISHEPGIIHVDLSKIFNNIKTSFPPNVQMDGTTVDPDLLSNIIQQISNIIEAEITETIAHESQHVLDYVGSLESGRPFSSISETPAEQFGKQIRQRYF